jgi:phosphate transport system substrate-binding protein
MKRTLAVAALALVATGCTRTDPGGGGEGSATAADKSAIAVKGSDTMVLLGQRWAEEFMKQNPGVTIQVTGGGSGTGIAALINGTTDICQSSRPMKDKEKAELKEKRNAEAVETKVALAALAFYLNYKRPVLYFSLPTLEIF